MGAGCRSVGLALAVLLGAGVPIGLQVTAAVAQVVPASEIDQAIAEGERLFKGGSGESLRQALLQFERAARLSRAAQKPQQEARSLISLGHINHDLGEYQAALAFYNQALPLYRIMGDRCGEVTVLNNIGLVYDDLDEKPKALEFYNQALPLSQAAATCGGSQASILSNIGRVYDILGEERKALEFYNQAFQRFRAVGDHSGMTTTLNNMGRAHHMLGEERKALEAYSQAFSLLQFVDDPRLAPTLFSNMGRFYHDLGENQTALEFYNQALPLHRFLGDRRGEAITLNDMGLVHNTLGENQKALAFYNQALLLDRAGNDRRGQARTLNNMGLSYKALGENQKALELYHQALPILRAVGYRRGEATALNNIGSAYEALGEQQKALEFYHQALPITRAVGNRRGEAGTLNNIGVLLASQKQLELAIIFLKQSVNRYEDIRASNRTLPQELREAQSKTFARTYDDLSDLLIKQGRLPEAQAVLELLQLKELREYTRDAGLQKQGISLAPAEQAAFDSLLKQYSTINQFATQIAQCELTRCPQLGTLQTQRDQLNTAIGSVLDRLRTTLTSQSLDLSQLNTEQFTSKAQDIVNAQPGTVLIYPMVREHNIQFLLAFKAGSGDNAAVTFRAIDGPSIDSTTLFKTAQSLRQQLSEPKSDLPTLQATSQQLYNWLIKPLEPEINQPNVKHLVFASDKATRYIPLAVLHDGKDYLINKPYTLTTILAASETDPKAPRPTGPNLLAVGASVFPNNRALPFVDQELNAIVRTPQSPQGVFPGHQILNGQFDFPALKAQLPGHNFLHIATHGALDPGNIDNSYLVPGQGAPITKAQISLLSGYGLKNVNLVVLSACETAVGTSAKGLNTAGLELSGISYYFMKGGAKSVIASLWAVNDSSTALIMQRFYQHLNQGQSKAEALRQAQRDLLNLKDDAAANQAIGSLSQANNGLMLGSGTLPTGYVHPFFWAPFILIGNSL
jgi:CHAT domain-containing protein